MTSNVGAELLKREGQLGFVSATADKTRQQKSAYDRMRDKVMGELKNTFRPEFLNRIDNTLVFHSLTTEQIRAIVDIQLKRVRLALTEQEIKLEMDDDAKNYLVDKGYDQAYGARPLKRAIQNLVEDRLAEGILSGLFHPGDTVAGTVEEGEFKLVVTDRPKKEEQELVAAEASQ